MIRFILDDSLKDAFEDLEDNIRKLKSELDSDNEPEEVFVGITRHTVTPLVCVNCGGKIDRTTMNCRFCGTSYHIK